MDIVEQLRMHDDERLYEEADVLMSEAADEITRLRQQVSELTTTQCTAPWRDSPPCSGITRATEGLAQQVANLTEQRAALLRSADFWKAEHLAGNEIIKKLTEQRDMAVEVLDKLARLGNGVCYGNSDGNIIAQKALAAIQSSKIEVTG